jgi:signal peptidase I
MKKEQIKPSEPIPLQQKIKDFLRETLIVIVGFLFLNSFVIASFMVPTGSMENEVMTGDFLMVNKFIYGGCSPRNIPFTDVRLPWFRLPALKHVQRGDVIVFEFPGYREEVHPETFTYYLKRCMGLPGDTLQVINRVVHVNSTQVPIPRNMKFNSYQLIPPDQADPRIFPPTALYNEDNYGPIVIPYAGMKINLDEASLKKWDTFILRENHKAVLVDGKILIDGKPDSIYVVKQNYLFGMGDNRDNSLDSRFWGFIPEENLIGTPMIVYWSWSPDIPIYNIFQKLATVRLGRVGSLIQ